MFHFISGKEQSILLRKENEKLKAKVLAARSDIDYIAMMAEVELESEGEGENEEI